MANVRPSADGDAPGRQTKKDRIVAELRTLIATGELARGSRIQQDDLAMKFSTSITPVREAMRQLEAEGLLVSEPHRGVRVAVADLEEVRGVYVARRLLESYAAQRATARVTRRDLALATRLTDRMEQGHADRDSHAVLQTNREFHFLFYDRAGIPSLADLISTLWLAFPWDILAVVRDRAAQSVAEHRGMVEAVASGSVEATDQAFATHVRNSFLALSRHLTGDPDPPDPFALDVD